MPTTTLSRDVSASAAVVWSILTDVHELPSLSPSTLSVRAPGRLERVGDEFEQTVKLVGRRFTSNWQVTQFDRERLIAVTGSILPGVRYSLVEEVTPRGRSESTLAMTADYSLPFGPLGRLAGRLGAERAALEEAKQVLDAIAELATQRQRATP